MHWLEILRFLSRNQPFDVLHERLYLAYKNGCAVSLQTPKWAFKSQFCWSLILVPIRPCRQAEMLADISFFLTFQDNLSYWVLLFWQKKTRKRWIVRATRQTKKSKWPKYRYVKIVFVDFKEYSGCALTRKSWYFVIFISETAFYR